MMHRNFIAIVLATSVAITGLTTAPARADNDDLLKILGGVAAIAIIGAAINEARDDDDDYVTRRYDRNRGYYNNGRSYDRHHKNNRGYVGNGIGHAYGHGHKYNDRRRDNYGGHARPLPDRVKRKLLPQGCRVQALTRRGERFNAYSGRCLSNNFRYSGALPAQCAAKARISNRGQRQTVYGSRCLRDYGYRAARR